MGNLISFRSSPPPPPAPAPIKVEKFDGALFSSKKQKASLRQTLIKFLDTVDYSFTTYPGYQDLEQAVKTEILSYTVNLRPGWEARLSSACGMAVMAYTHHPIEIQFSIAIITWFGFTMDDCTNKDNLLALATFQQRYLTNQPQVDPLFDYFTAHLNKLWEYFHPIAANAAVTAYVDFASACYLETMTEGMKISPAAAHYPDYVRLKSGIADFYAFVIWPVAQFPDIRSYVLAIPAISRFINIVNDILSFYKEELAGETVNYVHLLRAVHRKESGLEVVDDLVDEAIDLSKEIGALLTGEAKEAWERWKTGYITCHLCDDRYKLSDLCLIEKQHATPVKVQ